ncbi:hypothetical protein OROGR_019260 [Orobanche gracilis]
MIVVTDGAGFQGIGTAIRKLDLYVAAAGKNPQREGWLASRGTLEEVKGVPEQFGSTDCGFFIMRYMKDIVEDKNLDFASKWRYMATPPHAYTPKHIDEVRVEWVRFLMKYHIK